MTQLEAETVIELYTIYPAVMVLRAACLLLADSNPSPRQADRIKTVASFALEKLKAQIEADYERFIAKWADDHDCDPCVAERILFLCDDDLEKARLMWESPLDVDKFRIAEQLPNGRYRWGPDSPDLIVER